MATRFISEFFALEKSAQNDSVKKKADSSALRAAE
jgi:hypothetical protein